LHEIGKNCSLKDYFLKHIGVLNLLFFPDLYECDFLIKTHTGRKPNNIFYKNIHCFYLFPFTVHRGAFELRIRMTLSQLM